MLRSLLPLLLLGWTARAQYVPPEALVEPLKPVGIRISIPHEQGISLVAFHVKFNEEFNGLEAGTIAKDIVRRKNDRWTYEDRSTKLKRNDVIYYWIHVIYDGLGYNLIEQEHKVTDFYDYKGQKIESRDDTPGGDGSCQQSDTKLFDPTGANSRRACAGKLIFEDDFRDFAQFQRLQWTTVEQFPSSADYEFVVYRNSPENIRVENGLRITPKLLKDEYSDGFIRSGNLTLENCTGSRGSTECFREARGWNVLPPVTSARVNTKNSINFEYGRVEVKAKFPKGDWIYPVLALESQLAEESSIRQVRVASAVGNAELKTKDGDDISGHNLWGGIARSKSKYNEELWSDDFHVYELIWSPGRIALKVDGQSYESAPISIRKNTPFYLTLGVAVGGLSEFPDNCVSRGYKKPWRNIEAKALYHFYNSTDVWYNTWKSGKPSLDVSYVKIWAL